MIPIRDSTRSERFPITNTVIIGINVLVFLWELGLGDRLGEVFLLHGIVPARYTLPSLASRFSLTAQILPFITSMFLHGGLLHVAGNMWFLHIFGDNVEDRLGPVRYFFFYMGCGILAGLTHVLLNWNSRLPTVGASGAIAGVMGAYFVLYPRAKVLTLNLIIPFAFFFPLLELPAFIFIGFWIVMQFINAGFSAVGPQVSGGVAWWAHFGGFVFGILLLPVFRALPETGIRRALEGRLRRRHSPHVNRITPRTAGQGGDTAAQLSLTPREARLGTRKVIVVPQGLRQRTVRVRVPPGVRDGTILRLEGLGRPTPDGPGNLYLRLTV